MTRTVPDTTTTTSAPYAPGSGRPARPVGTVLVTGAASGLGRAVAEAVAAAGGRPVLVDRVPTIAPTTEARVGEALTAVVDLADTAAAHAITTELVDATGGLDGVVTAAGIDHCGPFAEVDADDWERVVRVNLFGTAAVVRAALPSLRARGGRVVTVDSTLGLRAFSDATAYCASKFGVVGFTRALAAELAGEVGVTLLIPGGMSTAFFDGRPEKYRPAPDAVLNDPADVAGAVVYALTRPAGCELREMVVCPSRETSWP